MRRPAFSAARAFGEKQAALQRGEGRGGEMVEVGVSVEEAVALQAGEPVT